ncbi:Alpha/Beta hydrolase protein [Lanmaoa asiatica]|nr:Alpha/Beta hydrolase protein [Lanmaoa asiatica]
MSYMRYSGSSHFYKELAELPVPTSAKFINPTTTSGVSVVRISYSIRDHERNVKQSITKSFTLDDLDSAIDSPVISSTINQDPSEISAFLSAPSGKRHAFLKEVLNINGTKKRYVEVWSGAQLEASLEVTKQHGQFHTDDHFKSFSFTPSETALVYTAEANPETIEQQEDDPYPKFRFIPHFGEQLYTKKRPTLFVFRWGFPNEVSHSGSDPTPTTSVTALSPDQPSNTPVLFGQATFVTESRLYATGYEQTGDGKLLGVKGCFNRSTSIWELTLPSESLETATTTVCRSVKIETPGRSSRSPRVLFDNDRVPTTLFWLSNPVGGAHASTVSIHTRDLKGTAGDRLLVDAVHDPSAQEFPGLYTEYNLADSPFLRLGDKTYVLVQSLWRSRPTLISINVENGAVIDLTPVSHGQALYSWSLLGTDGARSVMCSRSTPTSPPETVLLTLTQDGFAGKIQVLDRPLVSPKLQEAIDRLDACVIPIPNRYPIETIVIRSKESAQGHKPVCLTIPHGGPHASSVTSFTPGVLAYALEGYTISLPNYTGSMGFGEKYIQELIGKCGTLDVADCIATVEELINLGLSEPGRQVVQGGSHGGFLAAHLIGQHPDVFSAAVMRNPVISAGELCASDISDWPFREFGLQSEAGTYVTPDSFATLYAASPIAHANRVKTPVLIMLGEDDLRVPPTQGKGYYHVLKGKGRVVEMLVFPKETHPIDGVEAARVSFEAGRDWFRAFTPGK